MSPYQKAVLDLRPDLPKDTFHARARRAFKFLAAELEIESYDLRTNKAGPASLGETTLHTDTVYVQTTQSMGIMVRSVKGRKDYTGGRNHFVQYEDPEGLLKTVRTLKGTYV